MPTSDFRRTTSVGIDNTMPSDSSNAYAQSLGLVNAYNKSSLSAGLIEQIDSFLNNPSIPQPRKDAFLSSINGLSSSLPSESFPDRLSQSILGTSNYQKAMNAYGSQVGALLAQYMNTDYQENYDSAVSQESRLRAAGINPNIGNAVDAGNSADFDDQSSPAMSPSSVIPSFAPSDLLPQLLSVVQGTLGFVSSVQGLIRNGVEIEGLQTSNISTENEMVRDMVLSSGFVPDSAVDIDFTKSYPDEFGNMVSFVDKKGNIIPYGKLTNMQKSALRNLVQANGLSDIQLVDNLFKGSGFSSNKISRLKGRAHDYLSSERYLSDWYKNYSSHLSNKLSGNKDSEDVLLNAFDKMLGGLTTALSRSNYNVQISQNDYNKKVYQQLIKEGVPEKEALQRANQAFRDEADNKVFDEVRKMFTDTMDPKTELGKNASGWDKFIARVGTLLLYYIRNK